MKKNGKKFWSAVILFGLIGQVAWFVENMYLNVFIYKMFNATAADISLMVGASALSAAVTTHMMGALSDKIGKKKTLIAAGYILWGITIILFGLIRMDLLTPLCENASKAAALGINITIILDCIMTFFGSTANDAAFNAWLTESGNENNRGKIEGLNAMMPLVATLVVFGGFMWLDLEMADNWSFIFLIMGIVVMVSGILGFFMIDDVSQKSDKSYADMITYSFKISTARENKFLYSIIGTFALFGISIQIFMPYLLLYYEKTLKMSNYVLVIAPAVVIAAVVTVLYGNLHDMLGFQKSAVPALIVLMSGYVILYLASDVPWIFAGSVLMMSGYLSGVTVFGAVIREYTPENMAGRFQGIRIVGQVLVPGVIGSALGAYVLRDAPKVLNSDGTYSFIPDRSIWSAALMAAVVVLVALIGIFMMMRTAHYELRSESAEKEEHLNAWKFYPRPQMKREGYVLLNDGWTLNGEYIRVPFPPQSLLSECKGKIKDNLVYETKFTVPDNFNKERILLHFGAVDQVTQVFVNGALAGSHKGGYLPFTMDVTELVNRTEENTLVVKVKDDLSHALPYGKQRKDRGGMWYTQVSGIWQPVWIENVSQNYIQKVDITPDLEGIAINIKMSQKTEGFTVKIHLEDGKVIEQLFDGISGYINIKEKAGMVKLWSPKSPYLYDMTIVAGDDEIETYFALRTIEIEKIKGVNRVCLNNEPVFLHGVLDQGYYCDGIFLPACEEEFERDILRMKELGFNMLRKHIKIEPDCFYYYCDKHGMLVVQDMVNNGNYSFVRDTAMPTVGIRKKKDVFKGQSARKAVFEAHTKETVEHLYNHPCIVAYTIFNEGWGQFDSDRMYEFVKGLDNSRLIDSTSGWFHQEKSDFDSVHIYFKTIDLNVKERPMFVSECGGYSRVINNHFYSKYNTYGYGSAANEDELTDLICNMYGKMILPAISKGACGCVYTQLSDVEDEVNGLYTYDRKVCKVNKKRIAEIATEIEKNL